ncbi:hypothetical protein SGRIM119S_02862 [Streptomyces griseorubiginosus]
MRASAAVGSSCPGRASSRAAWANPLGGWRRRGIQRYDEDKKQLEAQRKAAQKAGDVPTNAGPQRLRALRGCCWGLGAFSNLFQGEAADPWIAVSAADLDPPTSTSPSVLFAGDRDLLSTRLALAALGPGDLRAGHGYGGNWPLFFSLFGLATGAVVRLSCTCAWRACRGDGGRRRGLRPPRRLGRARHRLRHVDLHDGHGLYFFLSEAVRQLREARAGTGPARGRGGERLRLSRDLDIIFSASTVRDRGQVGGRPVGWLWATWTRRSSRSPTSSRSAVKPVRIR